MSTVVRTSRDADQSISIPSETTKKTSRPTISTTGLLRFTTAGSVDDGKSTLIGRLLYDSKSILDDQLASIRSQASDELDLARLTDGLRAEREQGITIDVAYRYFTSEKRKFIIADAPGHVEYTRNMVTAASNSDLSVIVVDALKGVSQQTRRHAYIGSLLGLSHLVVCVNKMDLVGFSAQRFHEISKEVATLQKHLHFFEITVIPISAYHGDNVVQRSHNMPWYSGPTVIEYLENVQVGSDKSSSYSRFPIQTVIRGDQSAGNQLFSRGYAGTLISGSLTVGDDVVILPGYKRSRIRAITTFDGELSVAGPNESVVIVLDDELDIGRGHVLVRADHAAYLSSTVEATVCWMDDAPLRVGRTYVLKQGTQTLKARVSAIRNTVDIDTLEKIPAHEGTEFSLNKIGDVELQLGDTLVFDSFAHNKATGSFILIDESTNSTSAAGLLLEPWLKEETRA